ncbi:unnamed protein product, partial [Ectocarpus fasciculatus]
DSQGSGGIPIRLRHGGGRAQELPRLGRHGARAAPQLPGQARPRARTQDTLRHGAQAQRKPAVRDKRGHRLLLQGAGRAGGLAHAGVRG